MNNTLNLSKSLCPDHFSSAGQLIRDQYPRNLTFDDKFTQLATYACEYGSMIDWVNRTTQYGVIAKLIAFIFGLLGSIAALVTLSGKEYSNCVTMMYHRSINAIEVFTSLLTLQGALQGLYGDQLMKSAMWAYFSVHVVEKLRNCLFLWVNLIVLWVAFERALACNFSSQFDAINRKSIARVVVVIAGVLGTIIFLPYGFNVDLSYNNNTQTYVAVKSEWAQSASGTYQAYSLFISITVIVHTVTLSTAASVALVGFVSTTKRKKALISIGGGRRSEGSRQLLRQCSLNIQLCILQMCETIPCIANELLFVYVIIRYNFLYPFASPLQSAPQTLTYLEARRNAAEMIPYIYLVTINGIGVLVSHYCRFYWYITFSPRIRRNLWTILKGRRNGIDPGTNVNKNTARTKVTTSNL